MNYRYRNPVSAELSAKYPFWLEMLIFSAAE